MAGFFAIFAIMAVIALVLRLTAGGMDRGRVEQYIRDRGGEVIECNWAPLGPGWFGEKSDRIYRVRYRDEHGFVHEAHCKTSMMTGVYFTEDRIIETTHSTEASSQQSLETLEEENQRLRAELEELRRQQRDE